MSRVLVLMKKKFLFLSELNSNSCFSPAEPKHTDDTHRGDVGGRYVWPATPPQSPVASDDDDVKSLSDSVRECVSADSSADECPVTPLTPRPEQIFNITPSEESHDSSNTERWVGLRNTDGVETVF